MDRWGHGGSIRGADSQGANRPLVLGSSALREERLLLMQTGSSSPCLDLRYPEAPPRLPPAPSAGAGLQPFSGDLGGGLGTRWLHRGLGVPHLVREANAPEAPRLR